MLLSTIDIDSVFLLLELRHTTNMASQRLLRNLMRGSGGSGEPRAGVVSRQVEGAGREGEAGRGARPRTTIFQEEREGREGREGIVVADG